MFDGKVGYDYQRQFKFGVVKLKKKKIILDNIRKQQYNNDGNERKRGMNRKGEGENGSRKRVSPFKDTHAFGVFNKKL